jgi:predicted kinase
VAKQPRPGWVPALLRSAREAHGLTLEGVGDPLRAIVEERGLNAPAANFQTIWGHENGTIYPGPHYRRAYCLLYGKTEPELGFRHALPGEDSAAPVVVSSGDPAVSRLSAVVSAIARHERLVKEFRAALIGASAGQPCLVLVGGYAGSGKTELSKNLARQTGWAFIDKDTISRALVEDLLAARGLDPHDRHSPEYLNEIRPREYECLMETSYENLARGASVVTTAPFIKEFSDAAWIRQASRCCTRMGALLVPIWVRCDIPTMHEFIDLRAAERDAWKLDNWDTYAATLDPDFDPAGPHLTVDNRHGAAVQLCDNIQHRRTPALP